jgi:hypothetical protein
MGVFLLLEASQPDGTVYRLALGWFLPPKPASRSSCGCSKRRGHLGKWGALSFILLTSQMTCSFPQTPVSFSAGPIGTQKVCAAPASALSRASSEPLLVLQVAAGARGRRSHLPTSPVTLLCQAPAIGGISDAQVPRLESLGDVSQ